MQKNIRKIYNWFLDFIFPKYCLGCRKENFYICENCFKSIPLLPSINCFICGHRSPRGSVCQKCKNKFHPALNGLLVASDWDNLLLRQIIYSYKYHFVTELVDSSGQLIINFLEVNLFINKSSIDNFVLIPVPLHKKRFSWRGFNQTELLAKKISQHFGLALDHETLKRPRYTLPQADIKNKKKRQQNVKSVFEINYRSENINNLKNKTVILIDDVCTTGSTLEECAKTLKPLKPKKIWGLVIARG